MWSGLPPDGEEVFGGGAGVFVGVGGAAGGVVGVGVGDGGVGAVGGVAGLVKTTILNSLEAESSLESFTVVVNE